MKIVRSKHVVEIIFDSPSTKNSFSLDHAAAWDREMRSSEVRLMILHSEGSVFCSGGNLSEYAAMTTKNEGVLVNKKIREYLQSIYEVPCLKVAFVTGDCFGGGLEVLSLCNKIYSLPHVFFGLWQSRMHLSFGWGGFERLSQRMSSADLKMWLSEGRTHSAYWCKDAGLIDEIVTRETMSLKLQQLMMKGQGASSQYFTENISKDEAQFFEQLWWSDEHRAVLSQFKNK